MGGSLDPALAAIIREVPGWSSQAVTATLIETGITNRNYRVDLKGSSFVVRLPGRDTELLGIDREAEHRAALVAAAAGVGPEVVAFVAGPGALVTRFVPGEHIPQDDLRREGVLARVVEAVRTFHGCGPIPSTFPVFRIVERYHELAAGRGVSIPATYDEARAVASRIDEAFTRAPGPLRACHNDLLNANLLRDGEHVWIVDYEYAGMGDPYFDLANLSVNNGLDEEACELVLRLYFGEVTDARRARLRLMRIVSDLREAMWGVVQQALSSLDFDYVAYADEHFARCLANAADPRLEAYLEAATEEH